MLTPRPHVARVAPAPMEEHQHHPQDQSINQSLANPCSTPVLGVSQREDTKDPFGFGLRECVPSTYTHAGLSSWTRNRQVPWKQNWL